MIDILYNNGARNEFYAQGEIQSGRKYYYATDHLGSVTDLLDINGTNVASIDYSPYGRKLRQTGAVQPTFGYAGMFEHGTSGLNLTWYRAYSPRDGRWLSEDPIGFLGGWNKFGYVGGDVVNSIDLLGLQVHQNYFNPTEPNFQRANKIKRNGDNTFYVGGHGSPTKFWDAKNEPLDSENLAHNIVRDPQFNGKNAVRLLSCEVGEEPANGMFSYAQQLANDLFKLTGRSIAIEAPNTTGWFSSNGNFTVYPRSVINYNAPDTSKPGKFETYYPKARPSLVY